jgi:hypothetical protein
VGPEAGINVDLAEKASFYACVPIFEVASRQRGCGGGLCGGVSFISS